MILVSGEENGNSAAAYAANAAYAAIDAAAAVRGKELEDLGGDAANLIYGTTKRALAGWIRRNAPTDEWAGAGIPLNAIAPGVAETPMTAGPFPHAARSLFNKSRPNSA